MKKTLLSLAAVALSALTASAQWAVVGAYSEPNWNFEASVTFSGEGDNLTCLIPSLIGDFKIVDITNNNWDIQYGTSTPIEIGQDYTLDGKNGNDEPANIKFAGLIQEVKNATVSWNPTTHVMKITAAEADIITGLPTLYVTGSFCDWNNPGEGASVRCTEEGGIYTATINLGTAASTEFKLAGPGWSNEIAGGATITSDAAAQVTNGGSNLKTNLQGEQTLTFNLNTMLMTFGDPELTKTEEKPARTWALVGSYSDPSWNFEASVKFTGDGNDLSCVIPSLMGDFKIVDITNNNWDLQYGTSTPVEIGLEYTLVGKNGNQDAPNTKLAEPVLEVKNATISWNPETLTMKITASEADIITGLPTLYVTGSFCGWKEPGQEGSVLCVEADGIYTAKINLGEAEETEFKLAGPGWSNEIAGGMTIGFEAVTVTKGGSNLKTNLQGEKTLIFNSSDMTMHFEGTNAVEEIEAAAAEAVYFNLQGIRVENPSNGIFIVKRAGKTSKVVM